MKNPTRKNSQKGSSRNVFLIIIAILLIGGAFAFAEYRNNQANNIYKAPEITVSSGLESAELDSDNDGLKDWEEILVGSDPNDPKSKVAIKSSAPVSEDLTENKAPLSQTDLISRDFFARYMELRQLGSSGDAFSQAEAAQKTIGNIQLPTPKSYEIKDILTKEDSSKEAVKQYGNEVAGVFKKYAINSRNEAVIAKEALDNDDLEILKQIDPIIASYKNITNGLLKIQVPKAAATLHLDLTNSMNSALFVSQSLRNLEGDPIAGLQAVNLYLSVEKQLSISLAGIKSYLSYLGLSYEQNELGSMFN